MAAVLWPAIPARAQFLQSDPWVEPGIVSTGDGDLYVEPNEHVRMRPRLHNDGFDPETLTTVRGTLEWSGIVSAPSGRLIWPDLAPHASAPATNELVIDPTSSYAFECGQELQVGIAVQTDQGRKWAPLTIATGEPDGRCRNNNNRPPVIKARTWQTPVFVNNWNELHLFDSYDPDGWIASSRITEDGRVVQEGDAPWSYPFQYTTPGRRVIKVELTDNDGASTSKVLNVDVLPKPPPRDYTPRPRPGPRFSVFLPRYLPTVKANRHGIGVRVECKRWCAVTARLQITRFRARKLGLKPPRGQRKLTIATDEGLPPNAEHHFVLRPKARIRRAFRRARKVPVLVTVTSYASLFGPNGPMDLSLGRRTTQAEVELIGPRRKRR